MRRTFILQFNDFTLFIEVFNLKNYAIFRTLWVLVSEKFVYYSKKME